MQFPAQEVEGFAYQIDGKGEPVEWISCRIGVYEQSAGFYRLMGGERWDRQEEQDRQGQPDGRLRGDRQEKQDRRLRGDRQEEQKRQKSRDRQEEQDRQESRERQERQHSPNGQSAS